MPDPAPDSAADWLLAKFDATDPDKLIRDVYRRPVVIQPMIRLKDDAGPGSAMHVTRADYTDTRRWWL